MKKELQEFKELFESSPNIAILNIDNGLEEISSFLQEFTHQNQGELHQKNIQEVHPRFRLKDRNFEYAVISDCLNSVETQEEFINGVYHSLENSAFIILLEKKQSSSIAKMYELLDTCNFRAINSIDIFPSYNLVMAKKLHMWGAGQ